MKALTAALAALVVLALAPTASAQVLLRRPYAQDYRLNYGFDHNGGSGCSDYECNGACYNGHTGSDFGTPFGTEVLAGADGTVVSRNDSCADYGSFGNTCGGRCGNYVQLQHADGTRTIYCHMRRGTIAPAMGATVRCGDRLGESASSGSSTGPHLHLGWRPSASGASDDPFRGACGGPTSLWVQQRAYREAPGTQCQCAASTEVCGGGDDDCDGQVDENASAETCNGRDDDCDGDVDEDDVCEVRYLHRHPNAYAPASTTDVDGDGLADVCGRGPDGVRCWLRDAAGGWRGEVGPIPWADSNGWDDVDNYATIRFGDLDGDGRADVCARANAALVCARATDAGFEEATRWHEGLSDDSGWDAPRFYTTIRLVDVDGDGRDDLCARGAEGVDCWPSDGTRFDTEATIAGPRWSDDSGWGRARHYGTIRLGDLDGDGRADLCARGSAGMRCHLFDGAGFGPRIDGPAWSNESGWGALRYWSTIRLVDVNGDGLADLCARSSARLACALSNGAGFEPSIEVAALSDDSGWDDESNYASLRVGDIDGDGAADLCLRANAGLRCWSWDGEAFAQVAGPEWSDASGWDAPQHYATTQMVDVDGDGLADACARASAGWRCHASMGASFEDAEPLEAMRNDDGWNAIRHWSTIRSATPVCRRAPETCNGRDDDCDGSVDEDGLEESCNAADDDCDGSVDEGDVCGDLPPERDAGLLPDTDGAPSGSDAGPREAGTDLGSGCACRASAPRSAGGYPGLFALALFALTLLRRTLTRGERRARPSSARRPRAGSPRAGVCPPR